MLSIERCDVEETLPIGDLFEQIGFVPSTAPTDESGDSYLPNEWSIEVLSRDGFYPVEGFRWTKPEKQVRLFHKTASAGITEGCVQHLQCSPEHIVMRYGKTPEWVRVGDLVGGDLVVGQADARCVTEVQPIVGVERLCDLQVADAHCYYTSGVLSHNSHFLVSLGCQALRENVDVLHYTLELSEAAVGLRYDSNLCDIDSNIVIENKDKVIGEYKNMKLGRLMIKEFPANTASIYAIRAHMERLDLRGFRPGLLLIDYADIMRSSRQYDSLRHELKLIYEELRSFLQEKHIPGWTASQSNREGSSQDVVDLNNMSEAYGKAFVADVVVSLSRRTHEKATGEGRLCVAKNRFGRDGLVYPLLIDTARSKFAVSGNVMSFQKASNDDERETKKQILAKLTEFNREKLNAGPKQSGDDASMPVAE